MATITEDQPQYVCDRCGQPAHQAAPDTDPQAAKWYHDHIADDVFCGLVMRAAERLPQ